MGQYYTILNLTKNEYIEPGKLGDGAKLQELDVTLRAVALLCANSNGRGGGDYIPEKGYDNEPFDANGKFMGHALTSKGEQVKVYIDALAGRWAGDRIVFQGDYAKRGDRAYVGNARLARMADISGAVAKLFTALDR